MRSIIDGPAPSRGNTSEIDAASVYHELNMKCETHLAWLNFFRQSTAPEWMYIIDHQKFPTDDGQISSSGRRRPAAVHVIAPIYLSLRATVPSLRPQQNDKASIPCGFSPPPPLHYFRNIAPRRWRSRSHIRTAGNCCCRLRGLLVSAEPPRQPRRRIRGELPKPAISSLHHFFSVYKLRVTQDSTSIPTPASPSATSLSLRCHQKRSVQCYK